MQSASTASMCASNVAPGTPSSMMVPYFRKVIGKAHKLDFVMTLSTSKKYDIHASRTNTKDANDACKINCQDDRNAPQTILNIPNSKSGYERLVLLYKFVTADNSQIFDGRVLSEGITSRIKRNDTIGNSSIFAEDQDTENESNSDLSSAPSQESQTPTTPSNMHRRQKSQPQHRDSTVNQNVSSIMRTPRFSADYCKEPSNKSPSRKINKLSQSLPPRRGRNPDKDMSCLLKRSASSGWIPGVEFSSAMEVYLFTP